MYKSFTVFFLTLVMNFSSSLVGQKAPDFDTHFVMNDNKIEERNFYNYINDKYAVLFFYPLDFTFVCPTEIIAFDKVSADLRKLDAMILGVSVDSQYCHLAWKNTPIEKGGIGNVQIPLAADIKKEISKSYGVLDESKGIAMRGVFVIDKEKTIQFMSINNFHIGRNIDECKRVIDATQSHEKNGEVCPANWRSGKKSIVPTPSGIADYLASNGDDI